tara:strand:- start:34179 stop:34904 length:726 start_codon:yes stop_codon:yes gene_type:complete
MTITKTSSFALILLASLAFTNCEKSEDDDQISKKVSEDDAVELIENSVDQSTGGMNETIESYSEILITDFAINDSCSREYDTSYTYIYSGPISSASYTVNWAYSLKCTFGIPDSVDLKVENAGTHSTNRMSSIDSSSAELIIAGLRPTASHLTFNGNLNRKGSQTISVNNNSRNISSTINISLNSVMVDKSDSEISSGTADISVIANNGIQNYTYNGILSFLGNGLASLSMNGNTYPINLK